MVSATVDVRSRQVAAGDAATIDVAGVGLLQVEDVIRIPFCVQRIGFESVCLAKMLSRAVLPTSIF